MLDLVEQIKGFILDGQVVYMHCWGGRGRAGTIASCFLASCYHLSAQETADRIQLAFDTRNDGGRECQTYRCMKVLIPVISIPQDVKGKLVTQGWRNQVASGYRQWAQCFVIDC